MIFLFWLSVAIIIYTYLGYPVSLYVLSCFRRKPIKRNEEYQPHVSLIVTVYNEQKRVQEKIDNIQTLDYPKDKLEVIFASDASTDKTEEIIKAFPQFRLLCSPVRKGKEFAQKIAIDQARGEIFVFSDVATMLESSGLKNITANFADPTVGCVSSEDRFLDEQGRISGEGAYVRYEMFLRRLESQVHSLVGLSGSFFAARREVCLDWAVDLPSDLNILLNSVKMGFRGIADYKSIGYYRNISNERDEFHRKVRTVLRGLSALMRNVSLLNIFKFGFFSWELFSHKVSRWLVPFFLILAFISNFFIIYESNLYLFFFAAQIIFYLLALIKHMDFLRSGYHSGLLFKILASMKNIFSIPYYFVIVNAAILIAWIKYFNGERAISWKPSKR